MGYDTVYVGCGQVEGQFCFKLKQNCCRSDLVKKMSNLQKWVIVFWLKTFFYSLNFKVRCQELVMIMGQGKMQLLLPGGI